VSTIFDAATEIQAVCHAKGSAEDLVVLKAFAGRHIDWSDVERVVARVGAALDADLILDEVSVLLAAKDALDDLDRLRAILDV
jgi:hypothetical protein